MRPSRRARVGRHPVVRRFAFDSHANDPTVISRRFTKSHSANSETREAWEISVKPYPRHGTGVVKCDEEK